MTIHRINWFPSTEPKQPDNASATEPNADGTTAKPERKRKVLYISKRFQDSHTDPDFLADMRINPNFRQWTVHEVMVKSIRLAYQISAVVFFYVMYFELWNMNVSPKLTIVMVWTISFFGHLFYQVYSNWPLPCGFSVIRILYPNDHIHLALIFLLFTYELAPILRTLTSTISSDTIHATSLILFGFHLITSDYGINGFMSSKTVSMNTAVLGSVCLASRLPTDDHSLALTTLGVLCFITFPVFMTLYWEDHSMLFALILVVSCCCWCVSVHRCLIYLLVMLFIVVAVPYLYVESLKYKRNVYGPWDEAVLNLDPDPTPPKPFTSKEKTESSNS